MLLDTGLLALLGLFFAFLLNRKREACRAPRAFESEFVMERTKRLDELLGLMLDVDAESQDEPSVDLAFYWVRRARSGTDRRPGLIVESEREATSMSMTDI